MARTILIMGNGPELTETLRDELESEGFEVSMVPHGGRVSMGPAGRSPDLVLLDVDLSSAEEVEVLARIRREFESPPLPILVLSRSVDPGERFFALERGADDVVAQPYDRRELMARIRALLRRAAPASGDLVLRAGKLVLEEERYVVSVAGRAVRLTGKEFELLKTLMEARGRVMRRDSLLERVWGYGRGSGIESRTLDVHVRSLRKKLGVEGAKIVTVRGVGYRFDAMPAREPRPGPGPRRELD